MLSSLVVLQMVEIERLSGDYIRGYTKAIQDISEIFEYIQTDLKFYHRNLNGKLSIMLLKTILESRERIRERIKNSSGDRKHEGFIRWNCNKKEFEWFCKENN